MSAEELADKRKIDPALATVAPSSLADEGGEAEEGEMVQEPATMIKIEAHGRDERAPL
jgi:hypothetical protein